MPDKRSKVTLLRLVVAGAALAGLLAAAHLLRGGDGPGAFTAVDQPGDYLRLEGEVIQLMQEGTRERSKAKFQQAEELLRRELPGSAARAHSLALLAHLEFERWDLFSPDHSGGPPAPVLEQVSEALRLNPRTSRALEVLACYHERMGNHGLALAADNSRLALGPGYMPALIHKSRCLLQLNRFAEAKANFREAIRINPHIEYQKFNGLAKIMIREGKYHKAKALLRKSITNYPFNDEAKKLLAAIRDR